VHGLMLSNVTYFQQLSHLALQFFRFFRIAAISWSIRQA
jgi:hypothetical protein